MKSIIISGPTNSGKTSITRAISATHQSVFETNFGELIDDLKNGIDWDWLLTHSLIVVEECSAEDILELAPKFSTIPIVFVTNQYIDSHLDDYKQFMVLNLTTFVNL